MLVRHRLVLLPVLMLAVAACSGDDESSSTAPGPTDAAPTSTTAVPPLFDGDPCMLITTDDLATLFPEGIPAAPTTGPQRCTWPVGSPSSSGISEIELGPLEQTFDQVADELAALGDQVSSLDGVGDRAVYVPGRLVFEVGGTVLQLEVRYADDLAAPGEPTTQDVLQRIAGRWALTF